MRSENGNERGRMLSTLAQVLGIVVALLTIWEILGRNEIIPGPTPTQLSGEAAERLPFVGGDVNGGDVNGGDVNGNGDPGATLDLVMSDVGQCDLIPGGSATGEDQLTFWFRVQKFGEGTPDQTIPVRTQSDTGLGSESNVSVSESAASHFSQVNIAPQDYGQVHVFTITVDPDMVIDETSNVNNTASISVTLPSSRPSESAIDFSCSSPT